MHNCGIYLLYFENNDNTYYVGQSVQLDVRLKKHISLLLNNRHFNYKVQDAYNRYKQLPTISIIELVDTPAILDSRETHWLDTYNTYSNTYNIRDGGSSGGYGEHNSCALYSKEVYIGIATELCTDLTHREIAAKLNVSDRVVATISSGQAHSWLEEAVPEVYKVLIEKRNSRDIATKLRVLHEKVFFRLVDTTDRLTDIANEFQIGIGVVEKIAYGTSCLFLKTEYPKEYEIMLQKSGTRRLKAARKEPIPPIMSPERIIHHITNIREFSRQQGLQQSNLCRVLNGKAKSHKGWTLATQTDT